MRLNWNYLRRRVEEPRNKAHRKEISFLHIGKNAGTQIAGVAKQINARHPAVRIIKHGHAVKLSRIPKDRSFFFSIRKPDARFMSGFYSRKRKGRPRHFSEWTVFEARAFAEFDHANDLAEALFEDGSTGRKALCAIKSIRHCSMDQIEWFDRCGYFLEVRPPVCIIRQERFSQDLELFLREIAFAGPVIEDTDIGTSHRTVYDNVPALSTKAMANLREWYRQDFEFYRACEAWMDERFGGAEPQQNG